MFSHLNRKTSSHTLDKWLYNHHASDASREMLSLLNENQRTMYIVSICCYVLQIEKCAFEMKNKDFFNGNVLC